MAQVSGTSVSYVLHYNHKACFDDGGPFHDVYWTDGKMVLKATNERAAITEAAEEVCKGNKRSSFSCHCHEPVMILTKLEEITLVVEENLRQTTERNIPDFAQRVHRALRRTQPRFCRCGKKYWPHKGEKACHRLAPVN